MTVSNEEILVSNIQRYSLHDGSGIRTTVFLKGCNLHCPWCSNPENINTRNQLWFNKDKCVGTHTECIINDKCCPALASGKAGLVITDNWSSCNCRVHALHPIGRKYSASELEHELLKDEPFWGNDGGVTFSGGEALLQIKNLSPVLDFLKTKKISICFETALFVPKILLETSLQYAEELFIDMKCLDNTSCKTYLGGNIKTYLDNLKTLENASVPYTIRIPLIKPYTYSDRNLKKIFSLLAILHPRHVEIFSCHNLGDKKYEMCGRPKPASCNNVTAAELNDIANKIKYLGKDVSILQI